MVEDLIRDLGCEHEWDRTMILTSDPPKYKCNLCNKTEYCYVVNSVFYDVWKDKSNESY